MERSQLGGGSQRREKITRKSEHGKAWARNGKTLKTISREHQNIEISKQYQNMFVNHQNMTILNQYKRNIKILRSQNNIKLMFGNISKFSIKMLNCRYSMF